jgi:hypothetical protein
MGVAIHIHHTVTTFQPTNVRAAHPAMRHQSRAEEPSESLIYNSGTNARSSVRPLPPTQPKESRATERSTHKSFCRINLIFIANIAQKNFILRCKILQLLRLMNGRTRKERQKNRQNKNKIDL